MRHLASLCLAVSLLPAGAVAAAPVTIPSPRDSFGFEPGDDRQLLDYEQLVDYLKALDRASDRVELREVGKSPEGRPMYVAFVSAPENLARLDALKEINRRLALEPALAPAERARLVTDGRVFVLATLSMHASEVGPSQALPALAYELATTTDALTLQRLQSVVLMIVPCHNPDGMDMVVKYYRQQKGTPYEGADFPGVWHKYVGHDNNRDFVNLTQDDTRVINRLFSTEWFPQVMVEKHQMGGSGPRYFVPPNHDPIAENVEEPLWSWTATFGTAMARDMSADGHAGLVTHWEFDDYWPGSTETSVWKGVISLLTEAASARVATPVYVEPTELSVGGKGLAEYKKGVNMLEPWPGGWWRLSDIVSYELSSMHSLLKTAALHHDELLTLRNELTRRAVEAGRTTPPYFYVLPRRQHDASALAEATRLLVEHGLTLAQLDAPAIVEGRVLEAGDVVVPLSQPFRALVKELLEPQRYPERHYTPGGELIEPYDITSWSLPAHFGLEALAITTHVPALEEHLRPLAPLGPEVRPKVASFGLAFPAHENDSYRAAFVAFEQGLAVSRLLEPTKVGDVELEAGSFVVSGKAERLDAIAGLTTVAPVPLSGPPVAKSVALRKPRIALVETWYHDIDAGWARYLLDQYHVPFTVLRPGDFAATDLGRFDVVLFPGNDKDLLEKGRYKEEGPYRMADLPPQYRKGLGAKGVERLVGFLDKGGVVVAWGDSVGLLASLKVKGGEGDDEPVRLPFRELTEERQKKGLNVPGSWLRTRVVTGHPLTFGLPAASGGFSYGTVLQTSRPRLDTDRRVVAVYPEKGVLASGYLAHEELIGNTPAAVWMRKGKGQVALYAFSPVGRGSTPATYKLLFNALLLTP
jgi:hypothetical protein